MRGLLVRCRLSVAQPRTGDEETPMNYSLAYRIGLHLRGAETRRAADEARGTLAGTGSFANYRTRAVTGSHTKDEEAAMDGQPDVGDRTRRLVAKSEYFDTVIIGGGQAELATGYHLAKRNLPFVILDANERIGDYWRKRWDSLRLFTPARYSGCRACFSQHPARRIPRKTMWPITSKPTRHASSCRYEPVSGWTGSPGKGPGTSLRPASKGSMPP